MKKILPLLLFFLMHLPGWSTHNRAGEITYEWLGGYKYRFTIKICTNEGSSVADRPELEIWYGDGERDTIPRQSETMVPPIGSFTGSENIYVAEHIYAGPATYFIQVLDPNRNQGIMNIASSVNVPFCIRTTLVISPFLSIGNNSCIPQEFPCPEVGCVGGRYCFNSAAYDPDGDSLSYELIPCMGENSGSDGCDPLAIGAVYTYPHVFGGGTISIDPVTGTFCWDNPQVQGEYNIAILIKEYRNGFFMGSVIRDIQITILGFCNNDPPVLSNITDTCVVAGQTVSFGISATDPNVGEVVTINEYGQPFALSSSPASFTSVGSNPVNGTFNWTTNCSHIRNSAYQVYFIAEDNDPQVPMIDVRSMLIRVVPPPVTGLSVTPSANTMILNWNANSCANIKGYKIYRKLGTGGSAGNCCDENTATDLGYTLIGTVNGVNNTSFVDAGALVLGNEYCYVIVAYMQDGAVSCPGNEACAQLLLDVPVITHVSVGATDLAAGIDTVRWIHPLELDTLSNFTGPYFYKIYQSTGFGNPTTLLLTTAQSAQLYLTQKEFIVTNLNTVNNAYSYRAELYQFNTANNTETLIGPTNKASSVFLSIIPSDEENRLSWIADVPWTNSLYEIQRESPTGSGNFITIASTDTTNYIDTGLTNGVNYCYRIRSSGAYSAPEIPAPLINYSQEVCSTPIDLTPPCAPEIAIDNDCEIPVNTLTWNNPNNSCADDVMSYNLYFTPVEGGEFTLLSSFNSFNDTSFQYVLENGSVAGCFYVTAIDSAQYGNESVASNIVCGDNCPAYFLPNVFSPNGDGENDWFIPFPYRFVEKININIYNRWGQLLFHTENPDVRWNGKNQENNQDVPEGVYFYTCTVYTIRLTGIEPVQLNGFIHLYRDNGASSQ